MGEEQGKQKKRMQRKAEEGGNQKNVKGGRFVVVLKLDFHCEGCAMKIKRSARTFDGVDKVIVDAQGGKMTVEGRFDIVRLIERVEMRAHRKVQVLSSPVEEKELKDKKKTEKNNVKREAEQKDDDKEEKKKKPKESTAVLMMKLRCDCAGCIQRIRRTIARFEGVDGVLVDIDNAAIKVKGTMDMKSLIPQIQEKLKRTIDIILPTPKDASGERKTKSGGDKNSVISNSEKKKNNNNTKNGNEGENKEEEKAAEVNRMEYYGNHHWYGYTYDMAPAPQIFSDENPNACVVM